MAVRGVRNHNPGNIRKGKDAWQGMAVDQSGDPAFVVFDGPQWGIRAMHKVLQSYQRAGKVTVGAMIGTWAPAADHNDTGAYVARVAAAVGVRPDEPISIMAYVVAAPMVKAMIAVECAGYAYPQSVVDEGLRLAGVVVPAAPAPSHPAVPVALPPAGPRPAHRGLWAMLLDFVLGKAR